MWQEPPKQDAGTKLNLLFATSQVTIDGDVPVSVSTILMTSIESPSSSKIDGRYSRPVNSLVTVVSIGDIGSTIQGGWLKS
ncbi:hypothetical protein FGO68_gene14775 [Halteria grandinella]|uniref:Uncharacterized protein n=1 Tax=Halteria grandinella TaxID=5974 RepID=A0A8J8TAZ0_HALGN|nr:hypothetical protein FGO68_gene14775 [Halteria grandinella]